MLNWFPNLNLTVTSTYSDSKVFWIKNVCRNHQHFSTLLRTMNYIAFVLAKSILSD